jgi:hypothetical protein
MSAKRPPRKIAVPEVLFPAILLVMESHRGVEQAISRGALVWGLRAAGYGFHERIVRECIKQLRRRGHLICSTPGEHGGYYIATSKQEFLEFDRDEFGAKISDMNETRQAMLKAVKEQFGEAVQGVLEL